MQKRNNKIKIAIFSDAMPYPSFDGVAMTLYTVFNNLPADKFDVLLITARAPQDKDSFQFPYYKIPYVKLPLYKEYPIVFPNFDLKLRKVLKEFNPSIVHITTPFFSGPFALKYAKQNNIPVLTIYHTHFLSYLKYYLGRINLFQKIASNLWINHFKNFYNQTNKILVPTNIIKQELTKYGIDQNIMDVWGRGVDTNLFNPNQKDPLLFKKITGNMNKNILFVSRLTWYKGLKDLVQINKRLSEKYNFNFIIIGDGPQKKYLEKNLKNAFLLGKVNHHELPKYYASADCFVFTSDTETFGNVVLEAMACGCPVVVKNSGGPGELVQNGVNGFKVSINNIDEFCSKIEKILNNKQINQKLSQNAFKYAQRKSWKQITLDLINHYQSLLQ